jgi:diadenosine tetraphosphate (Ap4A) HIT family hydrolase
MNIKWMAREKWEALVRGEGCPLCVEIAAKEPNDESGYTVADLTITRLRLCKNQYVKGYCVLISRKHVREPYELTQDEQNRFFKDMMLAGKALEEVFKADKMNFQILGNAVPHLHCHIEPRYFGDSSPNHPIDPNAKTVILSVEEYKTRVRQIREALK